MAARGLHGAETLLNNRHPSETPPSVNLVPVLTGTDRVGVGPSHSSRNRKLRNGQGALCFCDLRGKDAATDAQLTLRETSGRHLVAMIAMSLILRRAESARKPMHACG